MLYKYFLKLWMLTLVLGLFLLLVFEFGLFGSTQSTVMDLFELSYIGFAISAILSLPVFLLGLLVNKLIENKLLSLLQRKLAFVCIAFLGILVLAFLIYELSISYFIGLFLSFIILELWDHRRSGGSEGNV